MRPQKILSIIYIALISTTAFAAQDYSVELLTKALVKSEQLESGTLADWKRVRSEGFDGYGVYWGIPVTLDAKSSGQSLAESIASELDLADEYTLLASHVSPTREYEIFRELRNGLPVIGGRLDIALNKAGQLTRVTHTSFSKWNTSGMHALSPFVAATYLTANLEPANWQVVNEESFACWYPDADARNLRAAYWLKVAGSQPHQRYFGIVDAQSGKILLEWPGIAHEVLTLNVDQPYWQPYDHSQVLEAPCQHQSVRINGSTFTTNASGAVSAEAGSQANVDAYLQGSFVEVGEHEESNVPWQSATYSAPFVNNEFFWDQDHTSRPALNLYYHTMFIHDWYKILDPPYDALDYPVPAVANYGNSYDNAFWNGYGTYYGSGMTYGNFAMYSDVIYHEYTHGVTDGIYPDGTLPYTGQSGAMNEAWSDYFACTINGDHLMGEWLTGNATSYFRNLLSTTIYPQNWVGQVHGDSPFISAPLWTIRNELGVGYGDSLAHFARYALAETFFDYFLAVLETDDTDGNLANGTPNDYVIYDAFGRHGIGPGVKPNLVIRNFVIDDSDGNGNGFAEAGENVTMTFSIVNDVTLFPPFVTNAVLHTVTDDNTISLGDTEFSLGTIGPRDSIQIGPNAVTVSSGATEHWAVVRLDVTSDQFSEEFETPLEFVIGVPKVHVVTRALATDVDQYVTGSLRTMDKIFVHKRLNSSQGLDLSALPDTGMVVWLSGDATNSGLSEQDITTLTAHVGGGGRLVLSGKNILGGITGSDFARNTLGVDAVGRSRLRMTTRMNMPFAEGDVYLLTGSGGAANQDSMTMLDVMTNSTPVLRFGPSGNDISAVAGPIGGRTLVFGFGIEGIVDNSPIGNQSRAVFLSRLLDWAGHPTPADDHIAPVWRPNDFALQAAYPNPFNSTVRLDYNIGNAKNARLVFFDVLGREVHRDNLPAQSNVYSWQPSLASGVYFAILQSDFQTSAPQKLMLLR